jgi:hypothetical protein
MLQLNTEIIFNKELPFYNLIISFLAQLQGLNSFLTRGVKLEFDSEKSKISCCNAATEGLIIENLCSQINGKKEADNLKKVLKSYECQYLIDFSLYSRCCNPIKFDMNDISHEFFNNFLKTIDQFTLMSTGSLIISAWESTKSFHTKDPLWEFLRHCRNALAHNNKGSFHFLYNEPINLAQWREFKITSELQGENLFNSTDSKGFLYIGDALYLLNDIEKQCILGYIEHKH